MQLYFFLAVIVSLGCGSLPPSDVDPLRASIATAGMVAAWILLSHVGTRVVAKQVLLEKIDPRVGAELLDRQLDIFRWLGLGVAAFCLSGFGLARTLDSLPLLDRSMFLQAIVLLSPVIMMTIGTWSAEHRYGVLLDYTERGFANHVGSVWQAFRGSMAWLVAPILLLLAAADLLSLLPIDTQTIGWMTAIMILLFVPLGLPWLIRRLLKTVDLDEETDAWVCRLLTASGLRRTKAVRWDTGGQAFNAMVAGFTPPIRTLLISDRILDELPREQMAMVVLHEAAHLRRRHVPLRMLALLPAWFVGVAVTEVAGDASWAIPVGTVIAISLTLLILHVVSYRTEYDADVTACRIAAEISAEQNDVPGSYVLAADALAAALIRVTIEQPAAQKATWLHPGVADRIEWMRRHRNAPTTSNPNAGTIANPA